MHTKTMMNIRGKCTQVMYVAPEQGYVQNILKSVNLYALLFCSGVRDICCVIGMTLQTYT